MRGRQAGDATADDHDAFSTDLGMIHVEQLAPKAD